MVSSTDFRTIIEALDEPTLLVEGTRIIAVNEAARTLLGPRFAAADIRLVLRHPHALDPILDRRTGDVEITGIVDADRPWIVSVREAGGRTLLVRLTDRSAVRAAEKMRVDFVANASHELRTPLASILGYAETIADNSDLNPDDYARFGDIIRTEAKRMLQIVEDLLSLSRIEADRFLAPRERIEIGELVAEAVSHAQSLADRRQCVIEVDVEPGLPPIPGDRGQLGQVLDNLIANALRYGCDTSGCAVTVSARVEGQVMVLTIADTGAGIAPEHLPRLTQRFYRVDPARSRIAGGTGLGLSIVKHIVERHRGQLDIRSALGAGTQVAVSLPIRDDGVTKP